MQDNILVELMGDIDRKVLDGVVRGVLRGVPRAEIVPAGRESS